MNKASKVINDTCQKLPILYSLRNCPYAMRARIAIFKSQQTIVLRDVVLSNKPDEMIAASSKATVPILVFNNNEVIDESLDVMLWALTQTDPENLLHKVAKTQNKDENHLENNRLAEMLVIINQFDDQFKTALEKYKCAKRYKENNIVECRVACELFIQLLENHLSRHLYIMSNHESLVDIALLPFIRQFARVERQWYLQSPYPKVKKWLNNYLQSAMFTKVMAKHPLWSDTSQVILFGGSSK